MLPSDSKQAALVDQWVAFADSEINAHTVFISQLVKGVITPYAKPVSISRI